MILNVLANRGPVELCGYSVDCLIESEVTFEVMHSGQDAFNHVFGGHDDHFPFGYSCQEYPSVWVELELDVSIRTGEISCGAVVGERFDCSFAETILGLIADENVVIEPDGIGDSREFGLIGV